MGLRSSFVVLSNFLNRHPARTLHRAHLATKLQQLLNQHFRLFRRDAGVAKSERAFAGVQDGLLFFERW